MIVSVCLTPTLEKNWITPNFGIGGFYRVQQEFEFASGKSVNTARVIKKLNREVVCVGFIGGSTGEKFLRLLDAEGISGSWIPIAGETRLSITVFDPRSTRDATSICDAGPEISREEWARLSVDLIARAAQANLIYISGSVPPGVDPEAFGELIERLGKANKKIWLDLSGPMLRVGAGAKPFAIKVNAKEISELAGERVQDSNEALAVSRKVRDRYQVSHVIATLGAEGAVCSSIDGEWLIGSIHYPKITSTIGCGDSFLGALLVGYDRGDPLERCLHAAAAAASADTQKLGPGMFDLADYRDALSRITVERVGPAYR